MAGNTLKFFKSVWPFFHIMHERVKPIEVSLQTPAEAATGSVL